MYASRVFTLWSSTDCQQSTVFFIENYYLFHNKCVFTIQLQIGILIASRQLFFTDISDSVMLQIVKLMFFSCYSLEKMYVSLHFNNKMLNLSCYWLLFCSQN